jgi:hypothetical protein
MHNRLREAWVLATLVVAHVVAAQPALQSTAPTGRDLLNSERIEAKFGSYGIEVLESDDHLRVSSLFSLEDGHRVCRTFAVVRYPDAVDARLGVEHEMIVAGGSIGATFAARGWTVLKRHRYFGEISSAPRVASLMQRTPAERLAVHVYVLDVARNGERFEYAWIAEVHHPDYLDVDALHAIYGSSNDPPTEPDSATQDLLELVAREIR